MSELKAFLDVAPLRDALRRRMDNPSFRQIVERRLQQLDAPMPCDDGSPLPSGVRRLGAQKPSSSSSTGGSSSERGRPRTFLAREVQSAIDQMRAELDKRPWHDTIRFVSFDVPETSIEFSAWMKQFLNGSDCGPRVRQAIVERFPSMKNNPDTAMFLDEIILPFRSFFIAQVIVAVLQLRRRGKTTDAVAADGSGNGDKERRPSAAAEDPLEDTTVATARLEEIVNVDDRAPRYQSQLHAAHHAQDLNDVRAIERFLPNDSEGLKRHIERMRKSGVCTRYAEYHFNYLISNDADDDAKWIARMEPLAEAGLAHAQCDVGLCCLSLGRIDEGTRWLERAAAQQHTLAMLELGRHYFGEALGLTPSRRAEDAQATRDRSKTAMTRAGGTTPLEHVRSAIKWLDQASEVDFLWDAETTAVKREAKELLSKAEADAKRLAKFQSAKAVLEAREAKQKRWRVIYACALVALLLAFVVPWYVQRYSTTDGTESQYVSWFGDLVSRWIRREKTIQPDAFPSDDASSHVPRNRAFVR